MAPANCRQLGTQEYFRLYRSEILSAGSAGPFICFRPYERHASALLPPGVKCFSIPPMLRGPPLPGYLAAEAAFLVESLTASLGGRRMVLGRTMFFDSIRLSASLAARSPMVALSWSMLESGTRSSSA